MKRKLFGGLLFTAVMCLIMCTVVMAEDVPMTEEEITYVEESFSVETEAEEELIVAEEEEEFLEADGLVEDEEILEAAEDFSFNTAIPDPAFQTFLKERGWTTLDTISKFTELYLAGMGIEDLTGIKYFTNLQKLYCSGNKLTKLDVSGLTSLKVLYCDNNQLMSLDVSSLTALEHLACNNNELTSLDVSGCTALESLDCKDNQLTSLDVSTCTALTELDCSGNQLKTLDVSFCEEIRNLCNTTEPTIENGYLVYSNGRQLIIDPAVRVLTTHEHEWDDGVVTKEATTTEEGVKTYTCIFAGCRQTKTESIPKLIEPPQENTTLTEPITISKKPTIKKPAATKNKITVKWKHFKHTSKKGKKIWKKIKKVQVQCATDSAFTNIVKSTMVGKKTKAAIKGLAKKTTYYVRVRYYDGTGYSAWSKVKKVKTK